MDLRPYRLDDDQVFQGSRLLRYQPFILSDDVQTGVAYSWLHGAEGGRASGSDEWVCDRRTATPEHWAQFTDANARLRAMYEDWIEAIASRFPRGSLVDVGSNDGYFPVRAQMRGMAGCAGYDNPGFGPAFDLLNDLTRSGARFIGKMYDPFTHQLPGSREGSFDVAVASLVTCHLPDPLHFLACLGRIARRGVFLYTGMADSDDYTIHYAEPNKFSRDVPFPYGFDNDTGLSRGLLYKSMEWMGFKEVVKVPRRDSWLRGGVFENNLQALLFLR